MEKGKTLLPVFIIYKFIPCLAFIFIVAQRVERNERNERKEQADQPANTAIRCKIGVLFTRTKRIEFS